MTKIKICGLKRPEDVAMVNQYRPDYAGFVLAPGKRQVTPAQAAALVRALLPEICPVGVFVNAPEELVCGLVETGTIRAIQFHGRETEEEITRMKHRFPDVPVIRAVSMKQGHELRRWDASDADYLLLDAGNGGTGHTFDHSLIYTGGDYPEALVPCGRNATGYGTGGRCVFSALWHRLQQRGRDGGMEESG